MLTTVNQTLDKFYMGFHKDLFLGSLLLLLFINDLHCMLTMLIQIYMPMIQLCMTSRIQYNILRITYKIALDCLNT